MWRYMMKRLVLSVVTIWFIATATFFGMHAVPGDPLTSDKATNPKIRANLEAKYGLDKTTRHPVPVISTEPEPRRLRYLLYPRESPRERHHSRTLSGVCHLGHFGGSVCRSGRRAVGSADRAVPQPIAGHHYHVPSDSRNLCAELCDCGHWPTVLGESKQPSWHIYSARWRLGHRATYMILPAMVLGLSTMAYLTRLMRSSMLEIVSSDYIRTANAKGLPSTQVFSRHQLPNAVLPVVTVLGPAIASITTGGFVVEIVFAIPGLGRYFVQAVQQLDYTVIMGTTVFFGAFLVSWS